MNELITFQVTNPANDIQTETSSSIELSGDSIDNGTAPTASDSVRALSGGMNDIVLIWERSSDDAGVLGYEVYRDNVLLGNTPYPQFIDTDLINNQVYSYSIVAFDSVGNSSEPSSNPKLFEWVDIVIPNLGIPIVWGGLTIESGSLTILRGADLKMLGSRIVDVDGPVTIVGDAERPITLRGRNTGSQGTWDGLLLHGPGNKVLNHVNISFGGAAAPETDAIEIDCTGKERFASAN